MHSRAPAWTSQLSSAKVLLGKCALACVSSSKKPQLQVGKAARELRIRICSTKTTTCKRKSSAAAKTANLLAQPSCAQTREFFKRGREGFGKRGCRASCAESMRCVVRNVMRHHAQHHAQLRAQHQAAASRREKLIGEIVKHDAKNSQKLRLSRGIDASTICFSSGGRGVRVFFCFRATCRQVKPDTSWLAAKIALFSQKFEPVHVLAFMVAVRAVSRDISLASGIIATQHQRDTVNNSIKGTAHEV